jgi:hypothetical protein
MSYPSNQIFVDFDRNYFMNQSNILARYITKEEWTFWMGSSLQVGAESAQIETAIVQKTDSHNSRDQLRHRATSNRNAKAEKDV